MVEFTQAQMFDPNQEAEIKRRRKMAEQLQAMSAPKQTEVVSGFAVPQSGLEQLARGLAGGIGAYQGAQADQAEGDLAKSRAALVAKALSNTDRQQAAQTLAQDPAMADQAIKIGFPNALFGGATGQFADRLEKLGVDPLQAALIAKSGLGVGRGIDPATGMVSPMAGVPEAGSAIKYGEKAGEKQAELQYQPKIEAEKEAQTIRAKDVATAQTGVNSYADTIANNMQLIDNLIASPGFNGAIGTVDSKLMTLSGDTADSEAMLKQVQGSAFLDSIQEMRGLGALSNAEGAAATQAATRMQAASSEEGFRQAAEDYKAIMQQGLARMQQKAGVPQNMPEAAIPNRADPLAAARDAIAKGAPREAVLKRLQENGINPAGL
jgi:hypothetical protein